MRTSAVSAAVLLTLPFLTACGDAGDEAADEMEMEDTVRAIGVDSPAAAGGADRTGLALDTLEGAGAYLTDADGRALYLFTADSAGASACYDACAEAWPPLIAETGTPSALAPEVRSDLIGTLERQDGSRQVTYGGHPLYYYAEDTGPGSATGQDVQSHGGEWYLVTPEGGELESHEEGGAGSGSAGRDL